MRTLLPLLAVVVFSITANAQTAASKPTHPHATMQQRFEQANVSHDGHLTLDQAKTGIRAYYKTQHTLHHQAATSPHTPSS